MDYVYITNLCIPLANNVPIISVEWEHLVQ
jgi:hypothetical protein